MEKFKRKMIHGFIEYGKRHRKQTVPIIAALAVCLSAYYAVSGFCRELRKSGFRRRLVCVLAAAVLFIQAGLSSAFASGQAEGQAEGQADADSATEDSAGMAPEELPLPAEIAVTAMAEGSDEPEEGDGTENGGTYGTADADMGQADPVGDTYEIYTASKQSAEGTVISGAISASEEWNDGAEISNGGVTISGGSTDDPVVITVNGTVKVCAQILVTGCVRFTGGGTLLRDKANTSGSMLFLSSPQASLTVDKVTVDGNQVSCNQQQAIYMTEGSVTINSGTIIQNCRNQDQQASAVRITRGTFTVNGGTIRNNQSKEIGGAFYVEKDGSLIINGGVFEQNVTTGTEGYGGGCICNIGGKVTISGGTFKSNRSASGGAIWNAGTLTVTGGSFLENTATGTDGTYSCGNGIYNGKTESTGRTGTLYIRSNADIADQIYCADTDNKIYVTAALNHPVTVAVPDTNASEGRKIASGSGGYTLAAQDMSCLSVANTEWYLKLSEDKTSAVMTKTRQYWDVTVSGAGSGHTVKVGDVGLIDNGTGTYAGQLAAGFCDVLLDGYKVGSITVSSSGDNSFEIKSYTLTFNAGEGTVSQTGKTVYSGLPYGDLPEPARTGYTFGGWYTAADGGTLIAGEATADGAEDLTLYAKWTANAYTVSYDGNESTGGSTADSSHVYDAAGALSSNGFERKHIVIFNHNYADSSNTLRTASCAFAGWNTDSSGTGTDYADGAEVTNLTPKDGETVTLYAKWLPASVSYVPMRTGYTFGGWYTESACSGSRADDGGTYTPAGNVTLYAKWTADTYTISYELDGGASDGNPAGYTVESGNITLNNPTREGYVFTGWSGTDLTGSDNTSVTIPAGSTGSRSYTAHWTAAMVSDDESHDAGEREETAVPSPEEPDNSDTRSEEPGNTYTRSEEPDNMYTRSEEPDNTYTRSEEPGNTDTRPADPEDTDGGDGQTISGQADEEKQQAAVTDGTCGLCHICPTFLGICCFIWLAVMILAALGIIWLLRRKNKRSREQTQGRN